jgi:hypothetical protein
VQGPGRANLSVAVTQESFSTCNRYLKAVAGKLVVRKAERMGNAVRSSAARQRFGRASAKRNKLPRCRASARLWEPGRDPKLKPGQRPS